jgi:thiol-disulfide isomerase/thioredoxin
MRYLLIFCSLLVTVTITAQQGFVIKGNLQNIKPGTLVFLMNGSDGKTVATDTVKNGSFQLKGRAAEPDIFQVGFVGSKEAIDLFMENNEIFIEGDFNNLSNVTIKGSSIEQDYVDFKNSFNPLRDTLNKLVNLINPEKNPGKRDSLIRVFESTKVKVVNNATVFTLARKNSPVSPFVLYVVSPLLNGLEDVETRYNALAPEAKRGSFARILEKGIADAKIGAIGTMAINFSQKDTLGKPISLASFKGKYVLVDFWASWCGPCRQENPNLVAAFQKYKVKNFTVLGVSLDESRANWIQAIRKDKLAWTHVSDLKYFENEVAKMYRINSIPANFLIDPTGKIIARNLRGEELEQMLANLLK